MADDEPYAMPRDGQPTGMVEMPVAWIHGDASYSTLARSAGAQPHTPPRPVLGRWRDEFGRGYADGGLFPFTIHAHVLGDRSPLAAARAAHVRHPPATTPAVEVQAHGGQP